MTVTYTKLQQLRRELMAMTVSQSSPWDVTLFPRGAPYKPLMLIAISDAVSRGRYDTGVVILDEWLVQRYSLYVNACGPNVHNQPVIPFNYLQYEAFWQLMPKSVAAKQYIESNDIRSIKSYNQHVEGAILRSDLHLALSADEPRGIIRDCILHTFLGASLHDVLWDIQHIQ
jgi:predicted restriction endonuclease